VINKPRFTLPGDDGERHEGYAFDRPDGSRCEVPAETIRPKRERYSNVPMTRDEAYDVAIMFGLETGMSIALKPCGQGYNAVIPVEYLRGLFEAMGKLPL